MATLRENANVSVNQAQTISPYESWTSGELCDLLVRHNFQIRDSARDEHETLVQICEAIFGYDEEFAEEERRITNQGKRRMSIEEVDRMDNAAAVIQKAFIRRKSQVGFGNSIDEAEYSKLRDFDDDYNNDYDHDYHDDYDYAYAYAYDCEEGYIPSEYDECTDIESSIASAITVSSTSTSKSTAAYKKEQKQHNHEAKTKAKSKTKKQHREPHRKGKKRHPSKLRQNSMLRRINEQGDGYDDEIEVAWRKPSWKFAKRFETTSHPHKPWKMEKYDWRTASLGRHCHSNGCGEQLDLWNEGRNSEFSQYGSGITNYFKVRCMLYDHFCVGISLPCILSRDSYSLEKIFMRSIH